MARKDDGRRPILLRISENMVDISALRIADSVYDFNPRIAAWCVVSSVQSLLRHVPETVKDEFGDLLSQCREVAVSGHHGGATRGTVLLLNARLRAENAIQEYVETNPPDPVAEEVMDLLIETAKTLRYFDRMHNWNFFSGLKSLIQTVYGVTPEVADLDVVERIHDGISSYPGTFTSVSGQPLNIPIGTAPAPAPVPAPPAKQKAPPAPKRTKMAKPSSEQRAICDRAFAEKIFPVEGYFNEDGKRQYRRTNEPQPLEIPLRKDFNSERSTIAGTNIGTFGILINPKTGRPVLLKQRESYRVRLLELDGSMAGEGYFETERYKRASDGNSYSFSTMATGYPRVHTPSGVQVRGGGYGTVLYSALCLASHLDWAGVREFFLEREGIYDGVSSMPKHRSPSAEAWWSSAKVDFNLAYEISAANPFRAEDRLVYEPCDVYEYRMLAASNMVVAWRSASGDIQYDRPDEWAYDDRGNGKRSLSANRKAIVNMNVSGLTQPQFMFFMGLASGAKATNKELAGMEHRFDTKTDISWKFSAKRPTASGYLDGGLTWQASGQTQEGLSRAAEMPEEYERLAQERADLGWPFMAD
jgi:hypothetical protein